MEPYSPCLVTTPCLDTPSEVWLGKARYEEISATSSDVRRPRKTSRRNWVQLGGFLVLSALACCIAACLATRLNAASTHAAPLSADCQYSELSVPLQQFHLGAQVHFRLRNLHCQQEQEVVPQHTERTNAPYADCRADPAGLLQRFHLGAQVPYPRTHISALPTLQYKSLHQFHAPLHTPIYYPPTRHRSLACCASASALLLGPATCDQCRDSAARAGGGLQWAELVSYAMIPAACLLWLKHFLSLPHAYCRRTARSVAKCTVNRFHCEGFENTDCEHDCESKKSFWWK